MRHRSAILSLVAILACSSGASAPQPTQPAATRTFRMGFATAARPDLTRAVNAITTWATRSDAAIIHAEPKWAALLSGESPSAIAHREFDGLVALWRSRNLPIVVVIDATNGIDRTSEAPELVAAGRSITEPAVQALYRAWARTLATQIQPVALGLAAETNLIRFGSPARVYAAMLQMVNDAARDVRTDAPTLPLFVSVQVDLAWGRLQRTNQYVGVEQDFRDFPFTQWLGLSSYPYLAGFSEPEQMPDDWYTRPLGGRSIPTIVTEGGWTSVSSGGITSSRDKQARWIRRQMQLADRLAPRFVFQLLFADIDVVAANVQTNQQLLPFVYIGLADSALGPKPALAVWDSTFARARLP